MKLKIISDGTASGTRIVNADTGDLVEDVTGIECSITAEGQIAASAVRFVMLAADLTFDESAVIRPFANFARAAAQKVR